jgi:anti-sigma B factor antagonist
VEAPGVADGDLAFEIRAEGDTIVIAVFGEVDMATAPRLEECLLTHADGNVTVDLAAVGFLDSAGLNALVVARNRLLRHGHWLRTINEQDHVRAALKVTGLDSLFHGQ